MRFPNIALLLAMVLPSVLAGVEVPPAPTCSTLFEERCATNPNRVEFCGTGTDGMYKWLGKQTCGKGTTCKADGDKARCVSPARFVGEIHNDVKRNAAVAPPECPSLYKMRCAYEPERVQMCSIGSSGGLVWVDDSVCGAGTTCNEGSSASACLRPEELPCFTNGIKRCAKGPERTQRCGASSHSDHLEWMPDMTCGTGEVCKATDTNATCVNPDARAPPECTLLYEERCSKEPERVQVCSIGQSGSAMWLNKKTCDKGAMCKQGHRTASCAKTDNFSCDKVDKMRCMAGPERTQRCTYTRSGVLEWYNDTTCDKGAVCKATDTNATCVNTGSVKPVNYITTWSDPKDKREAPCHLAVCNPGDKGCDKDRRFLFECDKCGQWSKYPTQCWAPGACGGGICNGWPIFGGDTGQCRGSCESLLYLQCKAGSDTVEGERKCRESMCSTPNCRACDRCNYKMPQGGVQVDPITV